MERNETGLPGVETPTRKRKRFVAVAGGTGDYYEDVNDKYESEKKETRATKSETDILTAKATGRYLPMTVTGVRNVPDYGVCAACEYVSRQAPDDEPVEVLVPVYDYFPDIEGFLSEHYMGSKRTYLEKQLDAEVDVVPEEISEIGDRLLVFGNRIRAMVKKALELWFAVLVDGNSRTYRFNVGSVVQARVIGTARAGILFDIMGKPVFVHISQLTQQREEDARVLYEVGDREMLEITYLERDEGTGLIRVKAAKAGKDDAARKLYSRVSNGEIRMGTVNEAIPEKGYAFVNMAGTSVYCRMAGTSCQAGDRVRVKLQKIPAEENGRPALIGYIQGKK